MTATVPPGPRRPPPGAPTGWAALRSAFFLAPTAGRVTAAVLLGLLGFAVAVQVRSTQRSGLDDLRQSDLVRILDDTSQQASRLRQEQAELQETERTLAGGSSGSRAALDEARQRADTLGILAGSAPAAGPGITLTIADPRGEVGGDALLDAVEELRDAGAEALQVRGATGPAVRIVASTSFLDTPTGAASPSAGGAGDPGAARPGRQATVDGHRLAAPYELLVIGDPRSLSTGLQIPGGVVETLRGKGATAAVREASSLRVSALHAIRAPQYARPTPSTSPSAGG